jgi:beta-phosphoglucomutase-like phosphatase (HAD superfamily)
MIDAVLCELEGAVVDSAAQRQRALQRAFAGEGISLPDALYNEHCFGRSCELAVASALRALRLSDDPTLPELLVLGSRQHFRSEVSRGVLLTPGAADFLDAARAACRIALVTRAARSEAELLLSVAGLDSAFECIICSDDVRAPEMHGSRHEAALARLGRRRVVNRRRVLALEDGMHGARAALSTGVRCIIVGNPPHEARAGVVATPSLAGATPASLEALLGPVEEYAA